jgi:hypothetical protein
MLSRYDLLTTGMILYAPSGVKRTFAFCGANVRYWPKADIGCCAAHVRFGGVKRT